MTRAPLFTYISGASLSLCIAAVALWIRSYSTIDQVIMSGRGGSWSIASDDGQIKIATGSGPGLSRTGIDKPFTYHRAEASNRVNEVEASQWWQRTGVGVGVGKLILPHWLVVTFSAALPSIWVVARARQRPQSPPSAATASVNDPSSLAAGFFPRPGRLPAGTDPLRLLPEPVSLHELRGTASAH